MLIDEIKVNDGQYNYRFYLKSDLGSSSTPQSISGRVVEKGRHWVRVRQSSGYREHSDLLVALGNVLYIKEDYSAE